MYNGDERRSEVSQSFRKAIRAEIAKHEAKEMRTLELHFAEFRKTLDDHYKGVAELSKAITGLGSLGSIVIAAGKFCFALGSIGVFLMGVFYTITHIGNPGGK